MNPTAVNAFLWGGSAVASWVVGLFFMRFWRKEHDRFFAIFAAAFWVLAVNWIGLALTDPQDEARTLFYLVRMVAYLAILGAIIDKNRSSRAD
jgi:predicted permease